ncbi:MAG TPA: methyl-accepting chemotaxis protein [Pseudolabrys sp.]|nr:methyl-accepting chemotaxis protein [Pseudolabrys sp.]
MSALSRIAPRLLKLFPRNRFSRLARALDSLAVGIIIFDENERVLVCNKPYMEMYGVEPHAVKPGRTTLVGMIKYRMANGTFRENPEEYLRNLRAALGRDGSTYREPKLPDGRILCVTTHPMARGGWVAIHENITERRHTQEELNLLIANKERSDRVAALIAQFQNDIEGATESLRATAGGMEKGAQDMAALSTRASAQSVKVGAASEETAGQVNAVAEDGEILAQAISAIGGEAAQSSAIAAKAVEKAAATSARIHDLAAVSGEIGKVTDLISAIAKQTNLLALNATIEAARAGEAGRGFAVVAQEVKDLAGQTARATHEIAERIKTIQEMTVRSVDAIEIISSTIAELNAFSARIAAVMDEQVVSAREIAGNVKSAAKGVADVTGAITEIESFAEEAATAAGTLSGSANQVTDEIGHIRSKLLDFARSVHAL